MVEESYKSQFLGLFDEDLVKKVTSLSMTGPVKSISKEEMNRIADLTQIERSTREKICYWNFYYVKKKNNGIQ